MEAALAHIEHACELLQTDPMRASEILLALRSNPEALGVARHVLEHSTNAVAQFHATGLLQAALLGRWTELPLEERAAARSYLATLLLNHGERYSHFVSSQLLQTFAVLWKRGWAEEGPDGKTHFFQQVQALTHAPEEKDGGGEASRKKNKVVLASAFLLALVGEFSTAKSAALGLPLEFHRQAHKAFEDYGLLPCLEIGMGMLARGVEETLVALPPSGQAGREGGSGLTADAHGCLLRLNAIVQLCLETLSWDFTGFDPLQEPSMKTPCFISPPIAWRPYLLRLDLLEGLVSVYTRLRGLSVQEGEGRLHLLRQLLTQLASLQGPVFPTGEERSQYALFLLRVGVDFLSQSVEAASSAEAALYERRQGSAEDEVEGYGREVDGWVSFVHVCVSNFRLPVLAAFPFFPDLCQRLSAVTCLLLRVTAGRAVNYRGSNQDWTAACEEGWAMAAFETLIEAWGVLVADPMIAGEGGGSGGTSPVGPMGMEGGGGGVEGGGGKGGNGGREGEGAMARRVVTEAVAPVYHAYQSCRVTLSQVEAARSLEEDAEEEAEAIATANVEEQVVNMAGLGRLAPAASVLDLHGRLLAPLGGTDNGGGGTQAGCLTRLHWLLTRAGGREGESLDRSPAGVVALLEEARVLVQAWGHLIADDMHGEQPAIPEAIHRLCFHATPASTPSSSFPPSFPPSLLPATSLPPSTAAALLVDACTHLQHLAGFLLQRAVEVPDDPFLSPYLTETILSFVARFARTYLLPDPSLYRNGILAPTLVQAFGGEAGEGQVEQSLRIAWGFLTRWPSQREVAKAAIAVVRAVVLTGGEPLGRAAVRSEAWKMMLRDMEAEKHFLRQHGEQLVGNGQEGHGHAPSPSPQIPPELGYLRLASDLRGELLEVVVGGILARENDAEASQGIAQVAGPVETRLHFLYMGLKGSNGKSGVGRSGLVREVGVVAGLYAGMARAVDNTGQAYLPRLITHALEPLLDVATLCSAYPDALHAVLVFLRDYAEVQISSLGAPATMSLLTATGQALKAYASHNVGRTRKDANSKEEAVGDILCVLELLSHVASKDFVDFSAEQEGKLAADTVADVVFYGLERLIPLMSEELLEYPPLGKQYFTLVNSMVSTYTERVAFLPHPLFMQLLQSVMFGVQRPDSEIARDSLRALAGLASFHAQTVGSRVGSAGHANGGGRGLEAHVTAHPALFSECTRKLLHLVVYEGSVWDRLDAASNALLALILCDREAFLCLLAGILEEQPPSVKERLGQEFQKLMSAIPPRMEGGDGREGGRRRGPAWDRQTKLAFRHHLRAFATQVRPFMQMR